MEALVVVGSKGSIWGLANLLSRAGFSVDWIAISPLMRSSRFVRSMSVMGSFEETLQFARDLICTRAKPYDWVIPGDDETAKALGEFDWPCERKPKLLTTSTAGGVSHIFSKIGLSQVLREGGVQTPPFEIAGSSAEAAMAAQRLGYPVLLKVDQSAGGVGVHQSFCAGDVSRLENLFAGGPLLIQKWIEGRELDLSAIYLNHELVHFSCARIESTLTRFGLSVVRTYYPLPLVSEQIFEELATLGHLLGANGFTNISCIEAADGSGRYFFEVDMRPNAWMDYSRFYGEDAAVRIRNWFLTGAVLTKEGAGNGKKAAPIVIPYFLRMNFQDLARNRHGVWKFIPLADGWVVLRLLAPIGMQGMAEMTRLIVPRKMRPAIRRALHAVGVKYD
jgi:hypothetical protein